jgi:hypothetical protein
MKLTNRDNSIQAYVSSTRGLRLNGDIIASQDIQERTHDRLVEDELVFSFASYLQTRAPYALPEIAIGCLQRAYPRCLDMPLRLSGQSDYCIPGEWTDLLPLIEGVIRTEEQHNPHWLDYNTYLTIDCSEMRADGQQRHGGLHVDGFQGERITEKTKITRNYVATTNGGTRFYPQPFIVVDEDRLNVFHGFDLQAGEPVIADENCIYFMDAYCVHESGFASRDGLRTFLRITYDLKPFDRLGNTHNSMIDYDWEMIPRNVHATLASPTLADLKAVKRA